MEKLVDDGIAKSIGVSNFSLRQVDEILKVARIHPLHNQVRCMPSPIFRTIIVCHNPTR